MSCPGDFQRHHSCALTHLVLSLLHFNARPLELQPAGEERKLVWSKAPSPAAPAPCCSRGPQGPISLLTADLANTHTESLFPTQCICVIWLIRKKEKQLINLPVHLWSTSNKPQPFYRTRGVLAANLRRAKVLKRPNKVKTSDHCFFQGPFMPVVLFYSQYFLCNILLFSQHSSSILSLSFSRI